MEKKGYLLLVLSALLAGCQKPEPVNMVRQEPISVAMSDPAREYCVQVGGKPAVAHGLDGGVYGICQLANGKRCEEGVLLAGVCPR